MPKIGKVLWWDRRDREGIIVDGLGNQYYFNSSVVAASSLPKMADGQFIQFEISTVVSYVSCAKNVTTVTARAKKQAEQKFIEQQQLSLGGI